MSPEVEHKISTYRPKLAAEEWEAVADLVRDRVRAADPSTVEMAARLISHAAHLAAWAFRNDVPLEVPVVFSNETIERYVAGMDATQGSKTTIRGRLRRLRDAGQPSRTPRIRHKSARPLYTPDELVGLWRLACAQPTELRRHRLQALICLCAGTGCQSSDLRHIYDTSIDDDPEGPTWVNVGGDRARRVPVLAGFDVALVEVASRTEGLLVGPSATTRNLIPDLTERVVGGEDLPRLEVSRLRHTWLVCLMNAWVPTATLMNLAGTRTMRVLEDLLPYCHLYTQPVQGEVAEAVRNAWRPEWL